MAVEVVDMVKASELEEASNRNEDTPPVGYWTEASAGDRCAPAADEVPQVDEDARHGPRVVSGSRRCDEVVPQRMEWPESCAWAQCVPVVDIRAC